MIYEYAIEPQLLMEWAKNRLKTASIAESFGLGKPRLMAEYPILKRIKKIYAEFENSPNIDDFVKKRFVELFMHLNEIKVIRENYQYNGELGWLENAEHIDLVGKSFQAIISEKNPRNKANVLSDEYMGDWPEKYWAVEIKKRINKKAKILSATIAPMLQNCTEFVFIEPYFDPGIPKWTNPLRLMLTEFIKYKRDFTKLLFEIHLSSEDKTGKTNLYMEKAFKNNEFKKLLPKGLSLTVKRWGQISGKEKIHDRHILTDIGGIDSTFGFDEEYGEVTTSFSLMSKQEYYDQRRKYLYSPEFKLEQKFSIQDDI